MAHGCFAARGLFRSLPGRDRQRTEPNSVGSPPWRSATAGQQSLDPIPFIGRQPLPGVFTVDRRRTEDFEITAADSCAAVLYRHIPKEPSTRCFRAFLENAAAQVGHVLVRCDTATDANNKALREFAFKGKVSELCITGDNFFQLRTRDALRLVVVDEHTEISVEARRGYHERDYASDKRDYHKQSCDTGFS
jgi:hypothetical protein